MKSWEERRAFEKEHLRLVEELIEISLKLRDQQEKNPNREEWSPEEVSFIDEHEKKVIEIRTLLDNFKKE